MAIHLTRECAYEWCDLEQTECLLPHLPGIESVAEGQQLPFRLLELLLADFGGGQRQVYAAGTPIEAALLPTADGLWYPSGDVEVWLDSEGKRHRDFGLAAFAEQGAEKAWYQHGVLHRGHDLPAVINPSTGLEIWYRFGEIHRDNDLPALVTKGDKSNRVEIWQQHGLYHRDDGKPAIVKGYQRFWYEHGEPTRRGLMAIPGQAPYEIDPPDDSKGTGL